MYSIRYVRHWSRHDKSPGETLSENDARSAYTSRRLYTALVYDGDRLLCFVESKGDYIGVEFLDARLRSYVSYQFVENKPNMLFLSVAVFREFNADTDTIARAAVYYFDEGGQTTIDKDDDSRNEYWEATTMLDVSANWEQYPPFGDYTSIARIDRGLNLIH